MKEETFYCASLCLHTKGHSFNFTHLHSLLSVIHSALNENEIELYCFTDYGPVHSQWGPNQCLDVRALGSTGTGQLLQRVDTC